MFPEMLRTHSEPVWVVLQAVNAVVEQDDRAWKYKVATLGRDAFQPPPRDECHG
jgi:hypothetical protein